jgi:hypothetical protein
MFTKSGGGAVSYQFLETQIQEIFGWRNGVYMWLI